MLLNQPPGTFMCSDLYIVHVLCIQISDYFSGTAKCIGNFINRRHITHDSYDILVKYCIYLMQFPLQVNLSDFPSILFRIYVLATVNVKLLSFFGYPH